MKKIQVSIFFTDMLLYMTESQIDSNSIPKKELLFQKEYSASSFEDHHHADLFSAIMKQIGDGIAMDINISANSVEICIELYRDESLENTIKVIDEWCQNNFKINENHLYNDLAYELSGTGVIVEIGDIFSVQEIVDKFKDIGFESQVISHKKHYTEFGAGHYGESILLFIGNAVGQGLAWEVTKYMLLRGLGLIDLKYIPIQKRRQVNFEELKLKVSEATGANLVDLKVTDYRFNDNTDDIEIIYETQYRIFNVTYNKNLIITSLKSREK